jgi:Fe2+ transport system protein FeoA
LSNLPAGVQGVVSAVHGDANFILLLAARGLTVGVQLSVLRNSDHGLLLIMVRETLLASGRSEAAGIVVEPSATGDEPVSE